LPKRHCPLIGMVDLMSGEYQTAHCDTPVRQGIRFN
jgi:hypothetical protein